MLSVRDIVRSGFTLTDSIRDLLWRWPPNWHHGFPILVSIPVPNIHEDLDDVVACYSYVAHGEGEVEDSRYA
ncbi:hypothetical protein Tco_0460885 [Tanacetum coccineum]